MRYNIQINYPPISYTGTIVVVVMADSKEDAIRQGMKHFSYRKKIPEQNDIFEEEVIDQLNIDYTPLYPSSVMVL